MCRVLVFTLEPSEGGIKTEMLAAPKTLISLQKKMQPSPKNVQTVTLNLVYWITSSYLILKKERKIWGWGLFLWPIIWTQETQMCGHQRQPLEIIICLRMLEIRLVIVRTLPLHIQVCSFILHSHKSLNTLYRQRHKFI